MTKQIAEQIKLLKRGTVDIFSEAELSEKLTESARVGRKLRIKLGLDPTSPDNGPTLPDAQTTAEYMDLALQGKNNQTEWTPWLSDSRVEAVIFFAFNGHPAYWGHTNWLVLDEQGQVLPPPHLREQHGSQHGGVGQG